MSKVINFFTIKISVDLSTLIVTSQWFGHYKYSIKIEDMHKSLCLNHVW